MVTDNYSLTYFNEFGEECTAHFKTNEYHSLMELLFDKYIEEWGDCKGRAWCGTCQIQIIKGILTEKMGVDEKHTLSNLGNMTEKSRLACQIPINSELDNIVFRIIKDDTV